MGVPKETPIHETNLAVLAGIVANVVEIEGPIHREEIARRITSLWGLQRTGGRIAEAISKAIESATCSGLLNSDLDFVTHSRMEAVSRSSSVECSLVKPEEARNDPASGTARQAISCLVSEHVGVRRDEIIPYGRQGTCLGSRQPERKTEGFNREGLSAHGRAKLHQPA